MNIVGENSRRLSAALMALALFVLPLTAFGQTRVEMPKNKYKVSDDVQRASRPRSRCNSRCPSCATATWTAT